MNGIFIHLTPLIKADGLTSEAVSELDAKIQRELNNIARTQIDPAMLKIWNEFQHAKLPLTNIEAAIDQQAIAPEVAFSTAHPHKGGERPCVNCGEHIITCGMRENGDCCTRCDHRQPERVCASRATEAGLRATDAVQSLSNLERHSIHELELAGITGEDAKSFLSIVRIFANRGDSGFSASWATRVIERLLSFKPITPLTGDPFEWMEVGHGTFQNVRYSAVFKDERGAHDINGAVKSDDDGQTWFTDSDCFTPVTFPYTPPDEPQKIYVEKDHSAEEPSLVGEVLRLANEATPENPSHYSAFAVSPADLIEAYKLNFFDGNVVKYIARANYKNGLEDKMKALWYVLHSIGMSKAEIEHITKGVRNSLEGLNASA